MKRAITSFLSIFALLMSMVYIPSLALRSISANNWEDYAGTGNVSASDNTSDYSTTLSFTPANSSKRISTKATQKLDGLYISLTDINYSGVGLPVMISSARGGWYDYAGFMYIAASSAAIYYKEMVSGSVSTFKTLYKGGNYVANHTRQGIYMYFYKQADGSFKYILNGYRDSEFVMTVSEITRMFGSSDPEVYVSVGGGWYPPSNTNTSLKVREISCANSNRMMSYYDPYSRDALVLSGGDMENIVYQHYGNQGAYSASAKTMKLDGFSMKYANVSSAAASGNLWMKFDTAPGGVTTDVSSTAGIIFYLGVNGGAGKLACTIDGAYQSLTGTSFNNGTTNTRPSEVTVEADKQSNGDYLFTFTGNFTSGTNVLSYTVPASQINTLFGSGDPNVYLNLSSEQTQTINIAYISYIKPVTGVTLNKTSTSIVAGKNETLSPTISPSYATNKNVTWSSSNTNVATVLGGVVTAVAKGTANITVTTADGSYTSTCAVTVNPIFAASEWEDTNSLGNVSASDNTFDGSTTLSFTPANTNKRMSLKTAYKLDGLYLSLTDINYSGVGLPIMISSVRGGWYDYAGFMYIAASSSAIYYKEMVSGSVSTFKTLYKGGNYVANHTRQGIYMYFCKQADGSFKYILNGSRDSEFVITASEITRMFGSNDPEVYVSVGGGWYPPNNTNTSMKVREISSSNSNRMMSYYDPYSRDALVLSNGDMSNITYTHTGNQGAYSASAKVMKLNGFNFKYTNCSPAEVTGSLWMKFDTAPGGVTTDVSSTAGVIFYLATNGGAGKLSCTIDGAYQSLTGTAFNNGSANTRPGEITVAAVKQTNGDFLFTFTGNFTSGTNVLSYTVPASQINTLFGSSDPNVYLNLSSEQSQVIHIANITYTKPVTSVSLNNTAATLNIGKTEALTATVAPYYATNKSVTWSSSNTNVATVSNGVVTAVAKGTANITVTTADGSYTSTCVVTVNTIFVASEWEDKNSLGNCTATDNTSDGSTTLSFSPAHYEKRLNMKTAYKLDGLYISLTDVNYSGVSLPIMISPVRGGWYDNKGLFYIASSSAAVYYKETNQAGFTNTYKTMYKGGNYVANNSRQGVYMYFYKQADGTFRYTINGIRDDEFVLSSFDLVRMFGSYDPEVYVSIGGGWFPPDNTNTSLKVREISSSNSNRMMSYYDSYGRDALVLSNGDMSNITYTHTGNQGAYSASAKVMKLNGLNFKYTNCSPAEVTGSLWMKFDTTPGGVTTDVSSTAGVIFYLATNGGAGKLSCGAYQSLTGTAFNNGSTNTRPGEITVAAVKQANGDFLFTFTGNFMSGTNVLSYTVPASQISTLFGSSDPNVYLNLSSEQSQVIHIANITYTKPVTSVSLNKMSSTLLVGQTETLTPAIEPYYATNKSVTWSSSNTNVATVSNGVVTAVAKGTANITVTTADGSKTSVCKVTVKKINPNSQGISLTKDMKFENGFTVIGPSGSPATPSYLALFNNLNSKTVPGFVLSQDYPGYDISNTSVTTFTDKGNGVFRYENPTEVFEIDTQQGMLTFGGYTSNLYSTPRQTGDPWFNLLINKTFSVKGDNPNAKISDLSSINVSLSSRLTKFEDYMYGQADPDIHAAQFLFYLAIQNQNVNDAGYGEMIWLGISIFDNRYEWLNQSSMFDTGTNSLMVGLGNREIFSNNNNYFFRNSQINANPNNPWASFKVDVLDDIQSAYNTARSQGYFTNTDFSELYISGMNLGWEIPGTYNCEAQIKDLNVEVTKN